MPASTLVAWAKAYSSARNGTRARDSGRARTASSEKATAPTRWPLRTQHPGEGGGRRGHHRPFVAAHRGGGVEGDDDVPHRARLAGQRPGGERTAAQAGPHGLAGREVAGPVAGPEGAHGEDLLSHRPPPGAGRRRPGGRRQRRPQIQQARRGSGPPPRRRTRPAPPAPRRSSPAGCPPDSNGTSSFIRSSPELASPRSVSSPDGAVTGRPSPAGPAAPRATAWRTSASGSTPGRTRMRCGKRHQGRGQERRARLLGVGRARRSPARPGGGDLRQGLRSPHARARFDQGVAPQPAAHRHRPQGELPLVHNG